MSGGTFWGGGGALYTMTPSHACSLGNLASFPGSCAWAGRLDTLSLVSRPSGLVFFIHGSLRFRLLSLC